MRTKVLTTGASHFRKKDFFYSASVPAREVYNTRERPRSHYKCLHRDAPPHYEPWNPISLMKDAD